jgi:CRP/FNR family transcriptional regulator, cyclic AMP receptor protein
VLDQAPRSATATALAPCTVHVMSSAQFRALIRQFDAADAVARHAFTRVRESEQARFEISTLPVAQRLACALLRLTADGPADHIDLSQDQLARLIGASRNAVVTVLTRLRTQRIIATSRRHMGIRDPDALRALAAGDTTHPGDAPAV